MIPVLLPGEGRNMMGRPWGEEYEKDENDENDENEKKVRAKEILPLYRRS